MQTYCLFPLVGLFITQNAKSTANTGANYYMMITMPFTTKSYYYNLAAWYNVSRETMQRSIHHAELLAMTQAASKHYLAQQLNEHILVSHTLPAACITLKELLSIIPCMQLKGSPC
jgi:hypothetical protein